MLDLKKRDPHTLIITNKSFTLPPVYLQLEWKDELEHLPFSLKEVECDEQMITTNWYCHGKGLLKIRWEIPELHGASRLSPFFVHFYPDQSCPGMITFNFAFEPSGEPFFLIPGVLYGTNNIKNSKSIQPQLNYRADVSYPRSSILLTRADRSTHNAVFAHFNQTWLGINIEERTSDGDSTYYNGLGVDTRNRDELDRICLSMGVLHFPKRYIGKLGAHSTTEGPEITYIPFKKGEVYHTKGHFQEHPSSRRKDYRILLQDLYTAIHQSPKIASTREAARRNLAEALAFESYQSHAHIFPTLQSNLNVGDTAWTGGMQAAYPLLRASLFHPEVRGVVFDYIHDLTTNGVNPDSGFLYESKVKGEWKITGWWKHHVEIYNNRLERIEEFHSAYLNGQAICYILKSYQFSQNQGWLVPECKKWLDVCGSILNKVIESQRFDGALGVYFDGHTGETLKHNGFQGAWFLAALAEWASITKDERVLEAMHKAERYYYSQLEAVECWGMPMDTSDAVDEEGNLAYITAIKTIHMITQDPMHLEHLTEALHYEFSWKFAYNTQFTNEPLKSLNWSSCGGSITSSHNIHIHQMGNLVCEEMYYSYLHNQDGYILQRLRDTLQWGLGAYNVHDDYLGFGRKGWATEQFFHSDGKQDDPNRMVDGGVWPEYLSWAAACVLLSCSADIPDELYEKKEAGFF